MDDHYEKYKTLKSAWKDMLISVLAVKCYFRVYLDWLLARSYTYSFHK